MADRWGALSDSGVAAADRRTMPAPSPRGARRQPECQGTCARGGRLMSRRPRIGRHRDSLLEARPFIERHSPRTPTLVGPVIAAVAAVAATSLHAGEGRAAILAARLIEPYLRRDSTEPVLQQRGRQYGPAHRWEGREWIVRDIFQDRRGGVFVDVGANDYEHDSNA